MYTSNLAKLRCVKRDRNNSQPDKNCLFESAERTSGVLLMEWFTSGAVDSIYWVYKASAVDTN